MNLAELAERHSRYKIIPVILGIFLLGFSIRYLAAGPRIGPELDTWFHYRMVNYILDLGYIPDIDPLAYYPTGRAVWEKDVLGLPYFIAYTYQIARITGITLMDYMVAFPAIFTSLAAWPLYLLTKQLTNVRTGLLTAMLWQIIPSTLTRTHAGFVDKESLASVYIFMGLWLFINSIKTSQLQHPKTLLTPILAGIMMGFGMWTWQGTLFFILVIGVSSAICTLVNLRKLSDSFGVSLIIFTVFFALTPKIVQLQRFPLSSFYTSFIHMILIGLSLLYIFKILYDRYIWVKLGEKNSRQVVLSFIIVLFGGAWISGRLQSFIYGLINFIKGKFLLEKSLIGATVSENLTPSFYGGGGSVLNKIMHGDWYSHFNVTLFLAPLGIILLLNHFREKKDFASIFIVTLSIGGILGMRSDVRLSFVLTPALAILTAYSVFYFINRIQRKQIGLERVLKTSKKQKVKYKTETQLSNTKMAKLLTMIIVFGIVAAPTVASYSMLNGRKVDVPVPWYNAMIWLRDNTPEEAVLVSWWDYGYWEQALANRRSIADGGNAGPLVYNTNHTEGLEYRGSTFHRDQDLALMFTSPEEKALKYLRPYVDYEKVPTYMIVSYEEFGKSGAINHISECNCFFIFPQRFSKTNNFSQDTKLISDFIDNNRLEAYSVINFGNYWQMWFTGFNPNTRLPDPNMKNALLAKLLPFENTGYGDALDHFELVYKDEWNYVLIYKVV